MDRSIKMEIKTVAIRPHGVYSALLWMDQ